MPSVDASKNVLSAGANYAADDWATAGAEASLDFRAQARLRRGIDLGVGAEAGVSIEGGLQKFLSADVQGQASAAARVRAQVEVPLDLFDEAGLAVRLQAVAEAAAGVSLAIGLKVGDFLALAEADPRMRGVPLDLLKVFLHELDIQGGVMAKAAAAAMAYANLALTGRLIRSGADLPGFTVAAEAGVGLKAGAGFKVFARFKVADPRRLVRRSIDVAVDGGIDAVAPLLTDHGARQALQELRAPAKIALRAAFEVGMTLAENQGTFAANDGGKVALRCVQVALEELQRFILARAVDFASQRLRTALRDIGFDDARWQAAAAQRRALADRLRALPEEPFEATQANRDYWDAVLDETLAVAAALSGANAIPDPVRAQLALLWSAAQLLFVSVERISVASARASILTMAPAQATAPFAGNLPQPPAAIRAHINVTLGRNAGAALDQGDVVRFLLQALRDSDLAIAPEVASVLELVVGPDGAGGAEALDIVFSNLGAFARGANGAISAQASLAILRDGLRSFVDTRLIGELQPALAAAAGSNRDAQVFLDEVVVATLRTVTGPVFDTVLAWGSGDQDNQRALRELCSSLLLRLFGRSLVVAGDVLTVKAQETIQGELRQLAAHVDDAGGAAPTLAALTRLDRGFIAEILEETLLVCADTFEPMPAQRRAQVRDLLYQIIDTAPAPGNASAVAELRNAALIPNAEAAFELARLMGEEIAGNVVRFVQALLVRVGMRILQELQEAILAIQQAVTNWIRGLQALAEDLARQLVALLGEIDRLGRELEAAGDRLLGDAAALLGFISSQTASRARLRDSLASFAADKALGVLRGIDAYSLLPRELKSFARDRVRSLVRGMLDNELLDPVLDAVSRLSAEAADFLDDVRAIEPGDDVAAAVADLFLDRLEDAVRAVFGHVSPRLSLTLTVPVVDLQLSFGVSLPLGALIANIRGAMRDLDRFNRDVDALARSLLAMVTKENELRAVEDEHAALDDHRQRTDRHLAESRAPAPALTIVSPQPGAALEGRVTVTLRIEGLTVSWLGLDAGDQQRLFVWANQHALPARSFRVSEQPGRGLAGAIRGAALGTAAFGTAALVNISQRVSTPARLHPLVAERAQGTDSARRGRSSQLACAPRCDVREPVLAGLLGRVGTIERVNGKPAVTAPAPGKDSGYLPGRRFNPGRGGIDAGAAPLRDTLTLTVEVPASVLHEGINTVACTIVPGSDGARVEQVVSFLLTAASPPGRRDAIAMPGRLAWQRDGLAAALQVELADRFGSARLASDAAAVPPNLQQLAQQLWQPPRAARAAVVARMTAAVKAALPAESERLVAIRTALERGRFRPVVIAPAPRPADAAATDDAGDTM